MRSLVGVVAGASFVTQLFAWDGWSAFVALGTLALAGVTYRLVRATQTLATRTEADVRAQWQPTLLIRDRIPRELRAHEQGVTYGDGGLGLWVENVGRGPALHVQPWLDDFDAPGPAYGVPEGTPYVSGAMGSRLHTAIGQGRLMLFTWSGLGEDREAVSGSFTYYDMTGAGFTTRFEVRRVDDQVVLGGQVVEMSTS